MIDDKNLEEMSGHSPGPWAMMPNGQLRALGRKTGEPQSFGQYFGIFSTKKGQREHPANNSLIVSAPDLLTEVKQLRELFSIDEGSRDEGYCVTMRLEGCEYIGTLRLYKDEDK